MRRIARHALLAGVLWALAAAGIAEFALNVYPDAISRPGGGFASYYTSARLVRERADVARMYEDPWFRERAAEDIPGPYREIYNTNPPTTALMLLPLTTRDHWTARRRFTWLGLGCLAVVAIAVAFELRLSAVGSALFALYLVSAQPVRANFMCGQAYAVLLLVATLAWCAARRGRPGLFGALVGLSIALKTQGALWLVPPVARRSWKSLLVAAGVVWAIVLASLPLLHLPIWRSYLRLLPTIVTRRELATPAFQSASSLFRRLFAYDGVWSPKPLVDAPFVASALTLLVACALVAAVMRLATNGPRDLAFAAAIVAGLVVTPVSVDYHYALALLPIAILLPEVARGPRADIAIYCGALALVGLDLQNPRVELSAARSLLEYPKLAGASLLFLSIWRTAERLRRESA